MDGISSAARHGWKAAAIGSLALNVALIATGAMAQGSDVAAQPGWFEETGRRYGAWFPVVMSAITIVVLFMSVRVSRQATLVSEEIAARSRELTERSLAAPILLSCHERFDAIAQLLWETQYRNEGTASEAEAMALFRRYWGLQHEQYQYFRDGLIPERTLRYWLRVRYMDYNRDDRIRISDIDYRAAWKRMRASFYIVDEEFCEVFSKAMDAEQEHGKDRHDLAVDAAIARFRQAHPQGFARD